MPPARSWLWFALVLLANFLLVKFLFPGPEAPVEVPYTFFKEEVRAGNVGAIYSQGDTVEGSFEKSVTYPPKGEGGSQPDAPPSRTSKTFTTVLPSFVDPGLEEHLLHASTNLFVVSPSVASVGGLGLPLLAAAAKWLLVLALILVGGPRLARAPRPETLPSRH